MMPLWKPQTTEQEAQTLAIQQLREFVKQSSRRPQETEFVREPASAAWIVTLDPDAGRVNGRAAEIELSSRNSTTSGSTIARSSG
jgi:hypothetical protein